MKEKWINNWGLKLIAVISAILVWLLIMNNNDPVTTFTVSGIPVEFINEATLTENDMVYQVVGSKTVAVSVSTRSIDKSKITAADFLYAKAMGKSIKLLGISRSKLQEPYAMVAPFMISSENPLYLVSGVFNAICVRGNMLGDSMYYGRGAGKLPTASAVVGDVIDCARHMGQAISCLWEAEEARLADIGEVERSFFMRIRKEALEAVKVQFPGGEVITVEGREDLGYVTPEIKEKDCAAGYKALGDVILSKIRIGE